MGALDRHLSEGCKKRLGSTAGVPSCPSATASQCGANMIGPICVDRLLDSASRYSQGVAPRRRLDRLKIQTVDRTGTYQPFDLREDFRLDDVSEAPFFAASSETTPGSESNKSQSFSLTSTNSPARRRKRRYSAICSRVIETASCGMILVTVLPSTFRVSDQLGP